MATQKGLGKGLGALFGDINEQTETPAEGAVSLPLQKIEPNPLQPRKTFDPDELASLAESIRMHGIIQPLTVRKLPSGFYQIIAGERRWRAARLAGLSDVPVVIIEADDKKAMELALIENLQRADLTPIEEARGYQQLIGEYGLTQEQVAPLGITLKSMDEVAAESDVISLHLHLNKSTEGMIGADFFRKMKKDAFFINTARGAIVKEDELIAALRDGEIAGAGIDVLCSETVPADHPLIGMDNVILTPHAAWYSEEASLALLTKGAEEVVRGLNGEKLLHPFNGIYYAREVE